MSWKEPSERHSEDTIKAIHEAAHHIATAIKEGFQLMADVEAQALADLSTAVTNIGNAITAEIAALKAALAAAQPPIDHSPAIETAVSNLNALASSLTSSLPPAAAPAPASTPAPGA